MDCGYFAFSLEFNFEDASVFSFNQEMILLIFLLFKISKGKLTGNLYQGASMKNFPTSFSFDTSIKRKISNSFSIILKHFRTFLDHKT